MKRTFFVVCLGSLAVGLFFGFLLGRSAMPGIKPMRSSEAVASSTVSLMIDYGNGKVKTYPGLSFESGEDMLTFLEKQTEAATLDFATKSFVGLGRIVERIGEKTNGEEGKYWQYWVNNQAIPYGAEQYLLQRDDVIEWKFLNYKS